MLEPSSPVAGGPLRQGSRWLLAAARDMRERNKAVLLAHGREDAEQQIAREFERVAALVKRDLEGYPALQRRLLDEITRVEEDYKKCGEVPPPPPEWIDAISAVASVKTNGNELVTRLLEEINRSIKEIHEKTLAEYRHAYEERHEILSAVASLPREVTVLFIEHDMDLVFSFAERISVLVSGAIFAEGTPAEIAANREVRSVYLGSALDG